MAEPQHNIHLLGVADPVAAGTHFIAFLAMLGGMKALVRRTADRPYERALVVVYSIATLMQYAASAIYHTSEHDPLLRRIDHATIYLLIAGSFTALAGSQLRGWLRAAVLGSIWAFCMAGIVVKLFFFNTFKEAVDTGFYLGAGWFGVVPTFVIWRKGERRTTAWILAGALLYTAGALCELYAWPHLIPKVFNFHEVFHLCVMAAGTAFYIAVWRSVDHRLNDKVVLTRVSRT